MAYTNRHGAIKASAVSIWNIYYCLVCCKELKAGDLCAIARYTYKSCRYCCIDIEPVKARSV